MRITLDIPDDKYQFFLELVRSLKFVKVDDIDIPEEHKEIVRERTLKSKESPERLMDWDQVQDNFKFD